MFRRKAENSFGIIRLRPHETLRTAQCDRRSSIGRAEARRIGAHLRIAHYEAEHDLDRGDDRSKDQTAQCSCAK